MNSRFGHHFQDNQTSFRVWAPRCKTVQLETRDPRPQFREMKQAADGFYEISVDDVSHGDAYRFRLNGEISRPDPASHAFEDSVHQWNTAIDHRQYSWRSSWSGVPKLDLIIYELHIGTFTRQGTFASAKAGIRKLAELGVTAIELLPLAQCPGKWNWGYDGVGIWAVQNTYGTPDQFKDLVDHCHELGIAVILDVVFNHLGPEGNYLSEFGPFFNQKRKTPWGDGLNFDGRHNQPVRDFMSDCAVHWIRNYRLDGLRMDAVHFMYDDSDEPVSMSITRSVDENCDDLDWPIHLIGETNVRSASLTRETSTAGTGFDAVWSDCMMHSVLGIAQPGLDLCHREHRGGEDLARALHQGFIHENFPYERNDAGERAELDSFVIGFQNHDTVGNHPLGLRLHQLASPKFQQAAAALYLLYPSIPMIFMGEEFAAETPFLFFADFSDPWVREGVEKGRAGEFPELSAKLGGLSPLDEQSFFRSKLEPPSTTDAPMWTWYQNLIKIRKKFQQSGVIDSQSLAVTADSAAGVFEMTYPASDLSSGLRVLVRLCEPGSDPKPHSINVAGQTVLLSSDKKDPAKDGIIEMGSCEALVLELSHNR